MANSLKEYKQYKVGDMLTVMDNSYCFTLDTHQKASLAPAYHTIKDPYGLKIVALFDDLFYEWDFYDYRSGNVKKRTRNHGPAAHVMDINTGQFYFVGLCWTYWA